MSNGAGGDNWEHRIIVEKLKAAEPGVHYPQFLDGREAMSA